MSYQSLGCKYKLFTKLREDPILVYFATVETLLTSIAFLNKGKNVWSKLQNKENINLYNIVDITIMVYNNM